MPIANSSSGTARMMSVVREIRVSTQPPRKPAITPEHDPDEHRDARRDDPDDQGHARPVDGAHEDVAAAVVGAEPEVGARPLRDAEDVGRLALEELVRPVPGERREGRREDRDQDDQADEDEPREREPVLLEARPEQLPRRLADDHLPLGLGRRSARGARGLGGRRAHVGGGCRVRGVAIGRGRGMRDPTPACGEMHESPRSLLAAVFPLDFSVHFECFGRRVNAGAPRRRHVASTRTVRAASPIRVPHRTSAGREPLVSVSTATRTISATVATWIRRNGFGSG